MAPQLQAAIDAIQPLSPTERRQLLQILTSSPSSVDSEFLGKQIPIVWLKKSAYQQIVER